MIKVGGQTVIKVQECKELNVGQEENNAFGHNFYLIFFLIWCAESYHKL